MTVPNQPQTPPQPAAPPVPPGPPSTDSPYALDNAQTSVEVPGQSGRLKPWIFGGAGVVIGLLLGVGISAAASNASTSAVISDAVESCGVESTDGINLGDDGQSITMNTSGDESSGADYADVSCVLSAIETPDGVLSLIGQTRALDGRQTGEWNDLSASWGYHPDNGLNIVVEVVQD